MDKITQEAVSYTHLDNYAFNFSCISWVVCGFNLSDKISVIDYKAASVAQRIYI